MADGCQESGFAIGWRARLGLGLNSAWFQLGTAHWFALWRPVVPGLSYGLLERIFSAAKSDDVG